MQLFMETFHSLLKSNMQKYVSVYREHDPKKTYQISD